MPLHQLKLEKSAAMHAADGRHILYMPNQQGCATVSLTKASDGTALETLRDPVLAQPLRLPPHLQGQITKAA